MNRREEVMEKVWNVFVVDDDRVYRKSLIYSIRSKSKYVIRFFEYNNGIELFSNNLNSPDFIIVDYKFFETNRQLQDGVRLLERIKKKYGNIAVIMISGERNVEVVASAMRLGVIDFLAKDGSEINLLLKILTSEFESRSFKLRLGKVYFAMALFVVLVVGYFLIINIK